MVFGFKKDKSTTNAQTSQGGMLRRLRERLWRTREGLGKGLAQLLRRNTVVDDALLEEIETLLLSSDVGVEATASIIADLTARVRGKRLENAGEVFGILRDDMVSQLQPCEAMLEITRGDAPFVILMVGINGSGKTTTIGKLAKRLQDQGYSVMLAAGDTFRAAAVEQLMTWGERNDVPVVSQGQSADPASVIYDALQSAKARGKDILIADTAGRLHTQKNLMEELKKIKRVIGKIDPAAPHEIMLVLDAGIGQNAVNQALEFNEAVGVTGITVTKLDGTAKGGVLLAVAKRLGIPIRFIGVGEGIEDLREFKAREFVETLFDEEDPMAGAVGE
jgi:fused signal recognition particle receptor